METAEEHGS
jgi:hypothetical protein